MAKQLDKLQPAHVARFGEWREKWTALGLSTEPADFDAAETGARRLYELCKLPPPKIVLRMPSPRAAIYGGALAVVMGRMLRSASEVSADLDDEVRTKVSDEVRTKVRDEVRAKVSAEAYAKVYDEVYAKVHAKVFDEVIAKVRDEVLTKVYAKVHAKVFDEVIAKVRDEVLTKVHAKVHAKVFDEVIAKVRDEVLTKVHAEIRDEVIAKIRDEIRDEVSDEVRDEVSDEVFSKVSDEVGGEVSDEVLAKVFAEVGDEVFAEVGDEVDDEVDDEVGGEMVGTVIGALRKYLSTNWSNYRGAQMWAGWHAYVSFFRDIAGVALDTNDGFSADEALATSCGLVWFSSDVCSISDRPEQIIRDADGRLHNPNGLALRYRDGWGVAAWHGTRIPTEWVTHSLPAPADLLRWGNIEQRRAGCEMMGWSRILAELNARSIHKDHDPEIGELIEADIPDSGAERFLRVRCGTGRDFVLPVPREMQTARQANAWTYDLSGDQLNPEVRT